MKKIINDFPLFCVLFTSVLLCSCTTIPEMKEHSFKEPAIIQLDVGIANVFIVEGDKGIIVVDTGSPADLGDILDALFQLNRTKEQVKLIVLTHGHGDHAGGASLLQKQTKAPILGHAGDNEMFHHGQNRPLKPMNVTAYIIRPFIDIKYPPFELDFDIRLEEEFSLVPYGIDGKIIPLIGHTPGSLAIILSNGEAIVGDLMLGGYLGGALSPSSPCEHYFHDKPSRIKENIQLLLEQGVTTFYVGHGGPLAAEDVEIALKNGVFDSEE